MYAIGEDGKNFDLSNANTVLRLKLWYTKEMHTQLMQRVFNLSGYMLYVPVNVFFSHVGTIFCLPIFEQY